MKYNGKYDISDLQVLSLKVGIVRKKIEGAKIANIITPRHTLKNIKAPKVKEISLCIDAFGDLIEL